MWKEEETAGGKQGLPALLILQRGKYVMEQEMQRSFIAHVYKSN